MECKAPSQPRAQFEVKHLHTSYFSHTSPFIVVSASVNMFCPEAPRQRDQTETSFSLKSFQAWRYDTAGTVRVQQKIVAGSHGWQGAGEELCLFVFEIFILCWLLFGQVVFRRLFHTQKKLKYLSLAPSSGCCYLFQKPWPHHPLALIIEQSTSMGGKIVWHYSLLSLI